MVLLLSAPRQLGGIVLDVNTLVYSAAGMICGFQAVAFWVFAKVFAINHGLLPTDAIFSKLVGVMTLEVGALLGLALLVLGLALSVLAVKEWSVAFFGPLDPAISLRLVIPAATLLILGLQIMLASFFLSVLGLETR